MQIDINKLARQKWEKTLTASHLVEKAHTHARSAALPAERVPVGRERSDTRVRRSSEFFAIFHQHFKESSGPGKLSTRVSNQKEISHCFCED
jgi:hypothetical protein